MPAISKGAPTHWPILRMRILVNVGEAGCMRVLVENKMAYGCPPPPRFFPEPMHVLSLGE